MATPTLSGLPSGTSAEFINLTQFCCTTKMPRLAGPQPIRITTNLSTPPGIYPLTIAYTTDSGVRREARLDLQVLSSAPQVRLPKLPELSNVMIPNKERFELNMKTFGDYHCTASQLSTWEGFVWYYDGARVYEQIANYTGDRKWLACSNMIAMFYSDYITSSGGVPLWRVFPHGLALHFQRTGYPQSRSAFDLLLRPGSEPNLADMIRPNTAREVAYQLQTAVISEVLMGESRLQKRMNDLVSLLVGYYDQWFVSRQSVYFQPFVVGLTAEALLDYYQLTRDPRIPSLIQLAADGLWSRAWDPQSGSFRYYTDSPNSISSEPAPDLNLLIAPIYAWMYMWTGDSRYRIMGDNIFVNGVDKAWLHGGKHFSQNYRWSGKYVEWREAARPIACAPNSFTGGAPSISPSGATVIVRVNVDAKCNAPVATNQDWINVVSDFPTSYGRLVTAQIKENKTQRERSGFISIYGSSYPISQLSQ